MNTESLNREDVRRPIGLVNAVSVALFLTKATSTDWGNVDTYLKPRAGGYEKHGDVVRNFASLAVPSVMSAAIL